MHHLQPAPCCLLGIEALEPDSVFITPSASLHFGLTVNAVFGGIAYTAATIPSTGAIKKSHMMPHKPSMTITNLPTDVLSCIIRNLQEDGWQRGQTLHDIAALRSVCRSLRLATDLRITHAKFHAFTEAAELRSMTRRCPGDQRVTSLQLQACRLTLHLGQCRMSQVRFHLAQYSDSMQSTLYHPQGFRPSCCSSSGPTPFLRHWRRLCVCNACATSTCREQDSATIKLHA